MTKSHMSGPRLAERARLNRKILRHIYTGDLSQSAIADRLGISRTELSRKLDEDSCPGIKSITGFELLALMELLPGLAGDLGLHRAAGGGAAKAPMAAGAESMREVGEVLAELAASVVNGITESEAASLLRSLAEARRALNDLEVSVSTHVVTSIASRR